MLAGQDLSGRHEGRLHAVAHGHEHGQKRHRCLAAAHVTLHTPPPTTLQAAPFDQCQYACKTGWPLVEYRGFILIQRDQLQSSSRSMSSR